MTADDAPRTLLDAVVRDLQSAAFDGAMDVALSTTPAETPARRTAVEAANAAHTRDMEEEAKELIAYLAEHFAPGLDGAMLRLNDERPVEEPAVEPEAPTLGTAAFPVKGALAEHWRNHLGQGPVDPPPSL